MQLSVSCAKAHSLWTLRPSSRRMQRCANICKAVCGHPDLRLYMMVPTLDENLFIAALANVHRQVDLTERKGIDAALFLVIDFPITSPKHHMCYTVFAAPQVAAAHCHRTNIIADV